MDINLIYIRFKTTQLEDGSISCMWDFNDASYINNEDEDCPITSDMLEKQVLYAPDSENPLLIPFPSKIQLYKGANSVSEHYKAKNGYFKIKELLELVRTFMETFYASKYFGAKYSFNDLYFVGFIGIGPILEINWAPVENNMFEQLRNMIADDE